MVLALLLVPALILLSVSESQAQGFNEGWYIGWSLGISKLDPETGTSGYAIDDNSDTSIRLLIGYDIMPNLSVEGFYTDFGSVALDGSSNAALVQDGEIDYAGYGGSALWYIWSNTSGENIAYRNGWQLYLEGG